MDRAHDFGVRGIARPRHPEHDLVADTRRPLRQHQHAVRELRGLLDIVRHEDDRPRLLSAVTLPAIAPQVITALRVAAGLSWLVVVAAEMIAGRDGLGFAVWDARNGLRIDLLAGAMLAIGVIGAALDRMLMQLTRIPSVRWGYER